MLQGLTPSTVDQTARGGLASDCFGRARRIKTQFSSFEGFRNPGLIACREGHGKPLMTFLLQDTTNPPGIAGPFPRLPGDHSVGFRLVLVPRI